MMTAPFPFVMATHDSTDWPEWGSAPHRPLVRFDMAHAGEWIESVIGEDVVENHKSLYHANRVYNVVRCELCIMIHVWPLPSETDLATYYAQRFYQTVAIDEVAKHQRDRMWEERCVYGPLLDACERHIPQLQSHPRLFDIGAGCGIALETAAKRGWGSYGLEPDSALHAYLRQRGFVVEPGVLAEQRVFAKACSPDVVLLHETLEHQSNPEAFLLDCYDCMKPGALLVISVPNDFNPLQLAACAKYALPYYWLVPPTHINYFTPKTLQLLVRRCGFKIVDLRGTYPLEQRMLEEDGQCYVKNFPLWRQYTDAKIAEELAAVRAGEWMRLEALYRENAQSRIGRSIVLIAEKQ